MNAIKIDDLLRFMVEQQASDLHLKPMRPPLIRLNGKLLPLKADPIQPDVAGAVYLAHAAGADLFLDLVVSERSSDQKASPGKKVGRE